MWNQFRVVALLMTLLVPMLTEAACTGSCSESQSGAEVTVIFSGNGTFIPPTGVTSITVEAWGAGGGGASNSGFDAGGGGGGGAYASRTLPVTPGNSYAVAVGNGGGAGASGGNSTFTADAAANNVRAAGGAGSNSANGAAGGQAAASLGSVTRSGGSGGNGDTGGSIFGRDGGGGGGSATASANGGNGTNGGAGGTGTGNGGAGSDGGGNGNPGNVPGGGGGGAGVSLFTGGTGGAGANGQVTVRYTLPPEPLAIGRCEGFERGLGNFTVNSSGGDAGINDDTSSPTSPTRSLFTRGGAVAVTSNVLDTSAVNSLVIDMWIRRGDDNFSEDPDNNEDLVIEYLNSSNNWVALETFDGGGTDGQIFTRSYAPGATAVHANFRLRIRQTGGNSGDNDYWHVDEICFSEALIANYRMDETAWNGTAGEVDNFAGDSFNGTAMNGANTATTTPARPGNPGTCGYGRFDGGNDYIQVNNLSTILNGTASLAFWIRTTQTGNNTAWQAPGVTGVEQEGGADDIFWGWLDATGRIGVSVGNDFTTKSTVAINNGVWRHVVLTRDQSAGSFKIYIDGNLNTSGSITTGLIGTAFSSIGRIEDTAGSPVYLRGDLDEVRIYKSVLTNSDVTSIYNSTHPCANFGPDHYAISHDGSGVTCLAEAVTIAAHDASDNAIDAAMATISIGTTTGLGDWSAILAGGGILNNGAQGDGAATYTFPSGETSVTLAFNYTNIPAGNSESFFFDVTDGGVTDTGNGDPEDPQMTFAHTGFRFFNQTDNNSIIPTQIAGKPSDIAPTARSLILQAIRSSDDNPLVCEPAFPDGESRVIELAAECRDPSVCAGRQLSINGMDLSTNADNGGAATGGYTPVTLNFGPQSAAPIVLNYPDAGLMQLHARYQIPLEDGTPSGDYMLGSSNDFVVRPFGFDIAVTGNPAATDADGNVFVAAGEDFDATITAVLWQQADDGNNDGIPGGHADSDPGNNADLSNNPATPNFNQESTPEQAIMDNGLVAPAGGNIGALAGGIGVTGFTNGVANTTLNYSEVGIIEIFADNTDYLGGGQNITGASGHVGRFIPFDFDVDLNVPEFASGCTAGANDFTYIGQTFDYLTQPVMAVTAKSKGKSNTTSNYTGDFFKLTDTRLASAGNKTYAAATGILDTNLITSPDPQIADNGDGTATLTFNSGTGIAFMRSAPQIPFDAEISLSMNVIDEDGVVYGDGSGNNQNPAVFADASAGNGIAFADSKEQRWGRLRLVNASGSELLPLQIPVVAEFYNASNVFALNEDDSGCTTLALGDFDLSGPLVGASTPTLLNPTLTNGATALEFSAPGAGVTGYIDVLADLLDADLRYLQFDWDGDGNHDNDPTGRATFGIYNSNSDVIYIREPW